ncbi:PREDICTED: replication protein A 70 kDa DNA-binding subunit-like [Wasmannia auropunctata]|uniref:replication protein A 70 kDa DNA-binding subunit-like n=1 Tax=Wasmannia auropunctata TaxID=64793 RepID=UPI0005EE7483|nr:PREDICTED: replication protein A 70 kDa DNA-binding subunit-like [Wasmannia auropunctata]
MATSISDYNTANRFVIPIAALNLYQNRWAIKVRVINKSLINMWSNSYSAGTLFYMDLIDDSGEIRCTAFKDQCDKFYDMIQFGNVYYISQFSLKAANKLFNPLKNDYEMTITPDTEIVPCHEYNDDIPTLQFNFCPISELENNENSLIDVLGVVKTVSDVQHIQHTTGIKVVKRDVNIVDDSGTMVCVTLWQEQAEDFDDSNTEAPIILAIKGAYMSEFNGRRNLSLISSSLLKNPDLPEAHRLRRWYTAGGH